MNEDMGVCPLCQAKIVMGHHSWMGDCSGCERSVNFCNCKPVRPEGVTNEKWRKTRLWFALYGVGTFKWDDGCLDDRGLKLLDEILAIFEETKDPS